MSYPQYRSPASTVPSYTQPSSGTYSQYNASNSSTPYNSYTASNQPYTMQTYGAPIPSMAPSAPSMPQQRLDMCRDFLHGLCSRGARCKFSHGDQTGMWYNTI